MTKGYIFDYGGTLDTCGCHWGKVLWHAYMRHGVPVSEQQFREAYVHVERTLGSQEIITPTHTFRDTLDIKIGMELDRLAGQGHLNLNAESMKELHKQLLDDVYANLKEVTERSRNVLLRLKEKYPIVLVSNFYGNLNTVLHEFGLTGLFCKVIESAAVGIRKPDPRIFSLAIEALGLKPEETVVVGDSIKNDIAPAKLLGCQTAWLKGEGWDDKPQDESLADVKITTLEELLDK